MIKPFASLLGGIKLQNYIIIHLIHAKLLQRVLIQTAYSISIWQNPTMVRLVQ
jgi:hypothetical protein